MLGTMLMTAGERLLIFYLNYIFNIYINALIPDKIVILGKVQNSFNDITQML